MVGGAMTFYLVAKAQAGMIAGAFSHFAVLPCHSPLPFSLAPKRFCTDKHYTITVEPYKSDPKNPHRVPVAAH
jgi:hypothetical protein